MEIPDFKTVVTLSKKESGRNLFGTVSFKIANFIYWIFFFGLVWASIFYSNMYFSMASMALIVSKYRYMVQYFEKNLEKHKDFISDIVKKAYASTGVSLTPHQVIHLWQSKTLWSGEYLFVLKEAEDPLEFDVAYTKKPKSSE